MLTEIPQELFYKIRPLIGDYSHFLVLKMLLDGKTPAKVWTNRFDAPSIAFVWDQLNTLFYLFGDSRNRNFNHELNQFITENILPKITELHYRKFFLLFGPDHIWKDQAEMLINGIHYEQRFILSYGLDPTNLPNNQELKLPNEVQLVQITGELLNRSDIKNINRITADIKACWKSTDLYVQNGGIGYCLLKENEVVAWCSTDYIIENECELYIETFEGHQLKGWGTQVGLACVRACLKQGLSVRWHCFDYAIGSVKIAEKIQLVKLDACPVYIADLKK